MFPNSYFPPTFFTPGYFTILATIVILPTFERITGASNRVVEPEDYSAQMRDDEEMLELITMMFQMGLFDV